MIEQLLSGGILTPIILILFVVMIAYSIFNVLREYERGVIFFLGRFQLVKGPGLIVVIPAIQQIVKVDMRTVVMDGLCCVIRSENQTACN
jgi:regulator of protease activity HflC (stomatin/prohibitin superfamily)